jgi:hypothetical protein
MISGLRLCWMCDEGRIADTREHKFKRSVVVRAAKDGRPSFLNSTGLQVIQGPKSDLVKFGKVLCETCNTARSRPYDLAFEQFAAWAAHQGLTILSRTELDFVQIYGADYEQQVLSLLRYMAKHLGCRIADDDYPVPTPLRKTFSNTNLHPFSVSFAVDTTWANVPGAENILENHALLAVFDQQTGQIRESYISGFSVGYMTIIYRYNYANPFHWEGDVIESPRALVRLGTYEPPKRRVFRIGTEEFEIPMLSIEQHKKILSLYEWPSAQMTPVENINARINIIHAIMSAIYPNITKEYLENNLDIPLSDAILTCY